MHADKKLAPWSMRSNNISGEATSLNRAAIPLFHMASYFPYSSTLSSIGSIIFIRSLLMLTCVTLKVKFTQNLVLFRTDTDMNNTHPVCDSVILQAKHLINKCKLNLRLPTLSCFIQLMLRYKTEDVQMQKGGIQFRDQW